ncbi:MAG: Cys6 transcription factor domain-containing protein [Chlamydiales bacterium]
MVTPIHSFTRQRNYGACTNCNKSKIRCVKLRDQQKCQKCFEKNLECIKQVSKGIAKKACDACHGRKQRCTPRQKLNGTTIKCIQCAKRGVPCTSTRDRNQSGRPRKPNPVLSSGQAHIPQQQMPGTKTQLSLNPQQELERKKEQALKDLEKLISDLKAQLSLYRYPQPMQEIYAMESERISGIKQQLMQEEDIRPAIEDLQQLILETQTQKSLRFQQQDLHILGVVPEINFLHIFNQQRILMWRIEFIIKWIDDRKLELIQKDELKSKFDRQRKEWGLVTIAFNSWMKESQNNITSSEQQKKLGDLWNVTMRIHSRLEMICAELDPIEANSLVYNHSF